MSQKRRGLGRGLGALIPSAPGGDRPVDVFFPGGEKGRDGDSGDGPILTAVADSSDSAVSSDDSLENADGPRPSTRARSWDSAIADGRLKIRTGLDDSRAPEDSASSAVGPIAPLSGLGELLEAESVAAPNDGEGIGAAAAVTASGVLDPANIPAEPDDVSRETHDLLPVPGARFAEISVGAITPNAWQPRTVFDEGELDELVDSIREIGVLQPIVVRPSRDGGDTYELIMGERRWRAAQAAGLETIPSIVRETDDGDMLRDALLENLHRAALNPLEEAAAYRQLLDDFGCTHEELASRIARSRPQISNTLRLLKLPPLVQRRVAAGVLSAGHARALLGLTDGAEIERLAQRIVSEGLSVRATEEIVTLLMSGESGLKARRAPRAGQRSVAVDELASRLSDRFETRVKVSLGKAKGRMTVEFASVDDLNRILELMAPNDPGLLRS